MIKCYYSRNTYQTISNHIIGVVIFFLVFWVALYDSDFFLIKKEYDILNNLSDLLYFLLLFSALIITIIQLVYSHLLYSPTSKIYFGDNGISIKQRKGIILFTSWDDIQCIEIDKNRKRLLNIIIQTKSDLLQIQLIDNWLFSLLSDKCFYINLKKLKVIIDDNIKLSVKIKKDINQMEF